MIYLILTHAKIVFMQKFLELHLCFFQNVHIFLYLINSHTEFL